MSRPRILIPLPTTLDEPYNAQCWPEYATAITEAGGEAVPLKLTHSAAELETMVQKAAGILLPGSGADVNPAHYGHERDPASAEPDLEREATDFALIDAANRWKRPLFGICFGTQSMNVRHGGTLIQDVLQVPVNHRAGRSVQSAHSAVFPADSLLGRILLQSGEVTAEDDEYARLLVNSSHHQSVAIAGDALRVVARCPADAVIEAVEGSDPEQWLLGVQWHPERTLGSSAASRALFVAFLTAAAMNV